ncbi:MAG TPA: aminotransferase class I/II-fold pyridoxal phosphate-dependent enzyme [Bryobacteraceae bacterium]|nr:aminotransferase class I/II-fold pyridoxal phosphate-dependent enzyme [Bryobacteraceae bacterium]
MLTRRGFAGVVAAAGFTEFAFAQRATVAGAAPKDTVWLNANEFPEGPPAAAIQAMSRVIGETNRYHYREFGDFYKSIAAIEGLKGDQVLIGAGSSEVLHAAVDVFTSPKRPFVTCWPTFEAGPELAAVEGHAVVKLPLSSSYASDVKKLVAEAAKAGGGLIYICNPNNPTGAITTKQDLAWTVDNLPPDTTLLVDEAYLHFNTSPETESAMKYVHQGKNVIVMRTFSKIYGMAGLRAGYVAARPDLIAKMEPYRNNVISIVAARAVLAALDLGPKMIDERRDKIAKTRGTVCAWLKEKKINFIDPQANFMMIDTKRDIKEMSPAMLAKGVAVGRAFPPYNTMMRVTIGTDTDMARFRSALGEVLGV